MSNRLRDGSVLAKPPVTQVVVVEGVASTSIELGPYGPAGSEVGQPNFIGIDNGPELNPPTGGIEMPSSGWTEV